MLRFSLASPEHLIIFSLEEFGIFYSNCPSRISAPQGQTHPQGLLLLCSPAPLNKSGQCQVQINHHSSTEGKMQVLGEHFRLGNGHKVGPDMLGSLLILDSPSPFQALPNQ